MYLSVADGGVYSGPARPGVTDFGQLRTEGGLGVFTPPPPIPKALQNRAKISPIVKSVKNC